MAESFENLDNILRDWGKIRYKKVLTRHWTGTRVWRKKEKAVSFPENDLSSLSRQSSETKPNTKLVLKLL